MTGRGTSPKHLTFPGMSQACREGDAIDVAGQVALRADGTVVDPSDVRGQAEQCFRNMAAALASAGANLSDVTQLTCYLIEAAHFPEYAAVKNALFDNDPPACTTVIVAALLKTDFLMEVAATARVRASEQETR